MLAGNGSYDLLQEREQAIVRAAWDERISAGVASLNFEADFTAAGNTWTQGDSEGRAIEGR